jgi:hypothetical protein
MRHRRHCERSETIQCRSKERMDLSSLFAPRNDG